jgi:hypothetical protein
VSARELAHEQLTVNHTFLSLAKQAVLAEERAAEEKEGEERKGGGGGRGGSCSARGSRRRWCGMTLRLRSLQERSHTTAVYVSSY